MQDNEDRSAGSRVCGYCRFQWPAIEVPSLKCEVVDGRTVFFCNDGHRESWKLNRAERMLAA